MDVVDDVDARPAYIRLILSRALVAIESLRAAGLGLPCVLIGEVEGGLTSRNVPLDTIHCMCTVVGIAYGIHT